MAIRIIEFAAGYQTDELPGTAVSADTIGVTPITNLTATNVQAALAEHQSDIDALISSGSSLAGTVSTHSGQISTLQSNVSNLQGRMTTAEGTITTHTAQIADKADATATAAALALKLAKLNDTATNLSIADKVVFAETTAPSSVPAGKLALFADATDHTFYTKDNAGTVSKLGGGGLVPSRLTALPTTLANGTAYQLSQAGSTTALLPVTALAATIEVTDVKGTCSATNFIGITAGAGDTILYKGVAVTDRFVIRRRNATVRFNKAAGSSVWEVTYQTIAVPQGGQIPGITSGSAILPGMIGETIIAYTAANQALTNNVAANAQTLSNLPPGKWAITGHAVMGCTGGTLSNTTIVRLALEINTAGAGTFVDNESFNSVGDTTQSSAGARFGTYELEVNISVPTTYYLSSLMSLTAGGTPSSYSIGARLIKARRVG